MSEQKTALVTGGSRGIGRAIVELLAQRGYRVMFTYLKNQAQADELVSTLGESARQVKALRSDVADAQSASKVVQSVIDDWGQLDALVNNAGTHLPDVTLADTPAAEWDRIIKTNLYGPFHLHTRFTADTFILVKHDDFCH